MEKWGTVCFGQHFMFLARFKAVQDKATVQFQVKGAD